MYVHNLGAVHIIIQLATTVGLIILQQIVMKLQRMNTDSRMLCLDNFG